MYLGAINYTGNKEKLLPSLIPLFPSSYSRIIDAFCGGLSVSLSVDKPSVSNDIDSKLIGMYTAMKSTTLEEVVSRINEWGLNSTDKDSYLKFRAQYNENPTPIDLLILQYHSFSNLIRFNGDKFNAPFGYRTFNPRSAKKFTNFKNKCGSIEFTNLHFRELSSIISVDDFVYVDPPYLITKAEYNKFWSDDEEKNLLSWLDELNDKNIKFGLSNVIHHRGKSNTLLINWMSKYNVKYLDKKYSYNIHHAENVDKETVEVFIYNY